MSITLRKKPMLDGRESLYLDIVVEGKRKKEYLKLHVIKRPKNEFDKQHNKETLRIAESIRLKREIELNSSEHGIDSPTRKNINFLEYLESIVNNYSKKDKKSMKAAYRTFKEFVGVDSIKPHAITKQLCIDYKDYLEQHFNGETPSSYFARFKKMLGRAVEEKILPVDPTYKIKNRVTPGIKKDVLTIEEIKLLAATPCTNKEVKRAFLFAALIRSSFRNFPIFGLCR